MLNTVRERAFIHIYNLCPKGAYFDSIKHKKVMRAAMANNGTAIGIIHPLHCDLYKFKPWDGDPQIPTNVTRESYDAFKRRLLEHLNTSLKPILVFLEREQKNWILIWLGKNISTPAPIIVLETPTRNPLPLFSKKAAGSDIDLGTMEIQDFQIENIRILEKDAIKYWQFLRSILNFSGIEEIVLTGEKYVRFGRFSLGCVGDAFRRLREVGFKASVLPDLTFPNEEIPYNEAPM